MLFAGRGDLAKMGRCLIREPRRSHATTALESRTESLRLRRGARLEDDPRHNPMHAHLHVSRVDPDAEAAALRLRHALEPLAIDREGDGYYARPAHAGDERPARAACAR